MQRGVCGGAWGVCEGCEPVRNRNNNRKSQNTSYMGVWWGNEGEMSAVMVAYGGGSGYV